MLPKPRVGYVLKMYPRFSETFIVTELVSMQRIGVDCDIFSLRSPVDAHFHANLAEVRAPVSYVRCSGLRAGDVWEILQRASRLLIGSGDHLEELLRLEVRDAAQAVEVALAVQERGITHLHAHFASVASTVARMAARLSGITYSLTAHAKDIFHVDVDADELRSKLKDASDVVTVSDFNLRYLQDAFGADAEGVRRVYNGLDLDEFFYRAPTGRPAVIAAVGRLVEKKGFSDLIDAVALLRRAGRDVRLDLVGAGAMEEELRRQVTEKDVQDSVTLWGALPQAEVRRIVGAAAVFAAPCVVAHDGNRDGLPTVVLEAMALGTPCVATPVTGIPEVISHGVTGLLVPERDPAALACALAEVLDDADLGASLAKSARDLVEEEFDSLRQAALVARGFPVSVHQVST